MIDPYEELRTMYLQAAVEFFHRHSAITPEMIVGYQQVMMRVTMELANAG